MKLHNKILVIFLLTISCTTFVLAQVPENVASDVDDTPRIAKWGGKVNNYYNVSDHRFVTDPNGSSGAEIDNTQYCKSVYPNLNINSSEYYKTEIISSWRDAGNTGGPYTNTVATYRCKNADVVPTMIANVPVLPVKTSVNAVVTQPVLTVTTTNPVVAPRLPIISTNYIDKKTYNSAVLSTVDLKINGLHNPIAVDYKSPVIVSWSSTGVSSCSQFGNAVPYANQNIVWGQFPSGNLPVNGSAVLSAALSSDFMASHAKYQSFVDIGITCARDNTQYFSDSVRLTIKQPTMNSTTVSPAKSVITNQYIKPGQSTLSVSLETKKTKRDNMTKQKSTEIQNETTELQTITGTIRSTHLDEPNVKNQKHVYEISIGNREYKYIPTGKPDVGTVAGPVTIKGVLDTGLGTVTGSIQNLSEAKNYREPARAKNQLQTRSGETHKTLVILVKNADLASIPFTTEKAHDLIFNGQFNKFTQEQSFGQAQFTGDVYGWLNLQKHNGRYSCDFYNQTNYDDLNNFVVQNNIHIANYDHLLYVFHCKDSITGYSYVGKYPSWLGGELGNISRTWVFDSEEGSGSKYLDPSIWARYYIRKTGLSYPWSNLDYLLAHEMGHAIGLWHANGYDCGKTATTEPCEHFEYGNPFDAMGNGSGFAMQFSADYKKKLGWIPESDVIQINQSGTYALSPLESPTGKRLAYISVPGYEKNIYALEYRKGIGFDAQMAGTNSIPNREGLYIHRIDYTNREPDTQLQLIDAKPTIDDWYRDSEDSVLQLKSTFRDSDFGIIVTVVKQNSDITFKVNLKPVVCVQTPLLISLGQDYFYDKTKNFAGQNVYLHRQLVNNNTISCEPLHNVVASFQDSPILGFTNFNRFDIFESKSRKSIVYYADIKPDAQPGQYPIVLEATNTDTGETTQETVTVTVLP